MGSTLAALNMYESCIVSSLLNNAEVWVGLMEHQEQRLDGKGLQFRILKGPDAPTFLYLQGMPASRHIQAEDEVAQIGAEAAPQEVLARQVLEEQLTLGLPGLGQEVTDTVRARVLKL